MKVDVSGDTARGGRSGSRAAPAESSVRRRRGRAAAAWIGIALIAWIAFAVRAPQAEPAPNPGVAAGDTWTFNYTGGSQLFTVPEGVTGLVITAVGGAGERIDQGGAPGNGGMTLSSFPVTLGETLTVWVGGVGVKDGGWGFGCGGKRGDASPGSYPWVGNAGGGGGSSAVTLGATTLDPGDCNAAARPDLSSVLTVAGGGGGGGGNSSILVCWAGNACVMNEVYGADGGDGGNPAQKGGDADINHVGGCGGCDTALNGGPGAAGAVLAQAGGSGGGGAGFSGGESGGGGGGSEGHPNGAGGGGGLSWISQDARASFYFDGGGQAGSVTLTAGQFDAYGCNGSNTEWVITAPADLGLLSVVAWGGQGGVRSDGNAAVGGHGGEVKASYVVQPLASVSVWVGCNGSNGQWGYGMGGNKGTAGSGLAFDGTGGGGSSTVFVGSEGIIAGGGGGGGGMTNGQTPDGVGGDGGQPKASAGESGHGDVGDAAGGCGGCLNTFDGANGHHSTTAAGGGGGGGGGAGYLSGDAGRTRAIANGGGGGGGTSWASDGTANVSFSVATATGDGLVELLWLPMPAAAVSTYGGNHQVTPTGTQFKEPLQARVVDSLGNPAAGIDVIFDLSPGGNAGTFAGQQGQVVTVATDANGIATSPPIVAGPPSKEWPASAQVESTGKLAWFSLTNQGFSSAVSLGAAPVPTTPNQDTNIGATVTGGANGPSVPTGNVVLLVQGATYIVPLVGGRAKLDLAPKTLALGSTSISASYLGDDQFEPNTASLPLDVLPTRTTVSLASNANPSQLGQGASFTAAVSVPPGNAQCVGCVVTFAADGATLGTSALGATGTAVFGPVVSLAAGPHTITASLDGGSSYQSSSGSMVQQVSEPVAVRVSTSPAPSEYAEAFDISVSVVSPGGPDPTGTVTIGAGGNLYCVYAPLVGGEFTCHLDSYTAQFFRVGSLPITASYGGDDRYGPATGAVTQSIVPGATTTSVVPSAQTVTAGSPVTFTVTVASPVQSLVKPFGYVDLLVDGLPIPGLESVEIAAGKVTTVPVAITSDGLHTISAAYQPAGTPPIWAPSSGSTQLAVLPTATTVKVSSLVEKTLLGEAPSFVAEVTVDGQVLEPQGSIQFRVNGISRGAPVPLVDGRAVSAPIAGLPAGDHDVNARFLPAKGLLAGSARHTHTISQPTLVMAGSSANPSHPRDLVAVRAHVGPVAGGGTLSFAVDGRGILGCWNIPVKDSTAECSLRVPQPGTHAITISYSGSHGYEPSTATIEQVVEAGRPKAKP